VFGGAAVAVVGGGAIGVSVGAMGVLRIWLSSAISVATGDPQLLANSVNKARFKMTSVSLGLGIPFSPSSSMTVPFT